MKDFVETRIITAVRKLLIGRVNEILDEAQFVVPLIELEGYEGGSVVIPELSLVSCERTDKERIIRLDAYSLTIVFSLPETRESELYCYAYAAAVQKALCENPTLGGIADRAVVTLKKYSPPKKPHCGEGWELTVALRITVEAEQ